MKPRLRPDDLNDSPYKELIDSLVSQWIHTDLSTQGMADQNYSLAIRTLLLTTQSMARTTCIVQAILAQASELHKTSAWVEQELKFEGMLEGADRVDFLRFELEQAHTLDDTLLDQYNERIKRFSQSSQ